MDGLDELLKFPSGAMYGGGYQDDFYVFMQDLDEPPVQLHAEPVILTAKKPRKDRIPAITEFYGQAALANSDIIAINGPGACKILSNPKSVSKEINPFIFLLTSPQRYDDINEIITKQIAFICLFHHLFFFAKRAKFPSFPTFIDGFPDKFAALQGQLGKEKDTKKEVFGVPIADLTTFWESLKGEIGSTSKETIANMLELLSKTPKEIYDYFLTNDVTQPGTNGPSTKNIVPHVPPVPPVPPAPLALRKTPSELKQKLREAKPDIPGADPFAKRGLNEDTAAGFNTMTFPKVSSNTKSRPAAAKPASPDISGADLNDEIIQPRPSIAPSKTEQVEQAKARAVARGVALEKDLVAEEAPTTSAVPTEKAEELTPEQIEEARKKVKNLDKKKGPEGNLYSKRRSALRAGNTSATHALKPRTLAEKKEIKEIQKLTEAVNEIPEGNETQEKSNNERSVSTKNSMNSTKAQAAR